MGRGSRFKAGQISSLVPITELVSDSVSTALFPASGANSRNQAFKLGHGNLRCLYRTYIRNDQAGVELRAQEGNTAVIRVCTDGGIPGRIRQVGGGYFIGQKLGVLTLNRKYWKVFDVLRFLLDSGDRQRFHVCSLNILRLDLCSY